MVKHYRYGIVTTKFPDMSKVIASKQQRSCRNLFREAIAYAKGVIADPVQKAKWQKKIRVPDSVYNAAVKEYMLRDKKKREREELETLRLLRKAVRHENQDKVSLSLYGKVKDKTSMANSCKSSRQTKAYL